MSADPSEKILILDGTTCTRFVYKFYVAICKSKKYNLVVIILLSKMFRQSYRQTKISLTNRAYFDGGAF